MLLLTSISTLYSLKVSKFQNENMKSSHCPKYEQKRKEKFWPKYSGRNFSNTYYHSYFGQWEDSIFSFWNLLTFSTKANYWGLSQCELSHCKSFCGLCQTFLWFFSWQIAIKYWNLPTKSLPIHCPHNHLVSHDSAPHCYFTRLNLKKMGSL